MAGAGAVPTCSRPRPPPAARGGRRCARGARPRRRRRAGQVHAAQPRRRCHRRRRGRRRVVDQQHAGVLLRARRDDDGSPVRSETRQLIRRSRSPNEEGPDAGELSAAAGASRRQCRPGPVVGRLPSASRRAWSPGAPAPAARLRHTGPEGNRPTAWRHLSLAGSRRPQRQLGSASGALPGGRPPDRRRPRRRAAGARTRATCSTSSASVSVRRDVVPGPRGGHVVEAGVDPRRAGQPVRPGRGRRIARTGGQDDQRGVASDQPRHGPDAPSTRSPGRGAAVAGRRRAWLIARSSVVGSRPAGARRRRRVPLASVIQRSSRP